MRKSKRALGKKAYLHAKGRFTKSLGISRAKLSASDLPIAKHMANNPVGTVIGIFFLFLAVYFGSQSFGPFAGTDPQSIALMADMGAIYSNITFLPEIIGPLLIAVILLGYFQSGSPRFAKPKIPKLPNLKKQQKQELDKAMKQGIIGSPVAGDVTTGSHDTISDDLSPLNEVDAS